MEAGCLLSQESLRRSGARQTQCVVGVGDGNSCVLCERKRGRRGKKRRSPALSASDSRESQRHKILPPPPPPAETLEHRPLLRTRDMSECPLSVNNVHFFDTFVHKQCLCLLLVDFSLRL